METKMECLVVIVNSGFTDVVMESARKQGARGGTIFHAKGTGSKDNEKFFGISITPDKEIVLILCRSDEAENMLLEINKNCGLATPGAGIGFSLPVSDVIGLKFEKFENTIEQKQEDNKEEKQPEEQTSEAEEK